MSEEKVINLNKAKYTYYLIKIKSEILKNIKKSKLYYLIWLCSAAQRITCLVFVAKDSEFESQCEQQH